MHCIFRIASSARATIPSHVTMSLAPPFTEETAKAKVKKAQNLWNTQYPSLILLRTIQTTTDPASRNPSEIAQAYTPDSIWRNRHHFFSGTAAITAFLTTKWQRERNYTLRKELFAFGQDRIAVQFWYEFQDAEDGMKWKRCYGLEDWTFAEDGRMRKRMMSGNDVEIGEEGRWFKEGVDVDAVVIGEEHW